MKWLPSIILAEIDFILQFQIELSHLERRAKPEFHLTMPCKVQLYSAGSSMRSGTKKLAKLTTPKPSGIFLTETALLHIS